MFGGATSYVKTLEWILEFVATHNPTTDELVGWHRGPSRVSRVGSRSSSTSQETPSLGAGKNASPMRVSSRESHLQDTPRPPTLILSTCTRGTL